MDVIRAEVDVRNIMMKLADKVSRQVNLLILHICWVIYDNNISVTLHLHSVLVL